MVHEYVSAHTFDYYLDVKCLKHWRWILVKGFPTQEKNVDNCRIRTYEGEPIWFQVKRLNHSSKLSYYAIYDNIF